MNSRAAARRPLDSEPGSELPNTTTRRSGQIVAFARPLTALVVAPTLHAGAADAGAVDLVRILTGNGHRAIVVSNGGRLEDDLVACPARMPLTEACSGCRDERQLACQQYPFVHSSGSQRASTFSVAWDCH